MDSRCWLGTHMACVGTMHGTPLSWPLYITVPLCLGLAARPLSGHDLPCHFSLQSLPGWRFFILPVSQWASRVNHGHLGLRGRLAASKAHPLVAKSHHQLCQCYVHAIHAVRGFHHLWCFAPMLHWVEIVPTTSKHCTVLLLLQFGRSAFSAANRTLQNAQRLMHDTNSHMCPSATPAGGRHRTHASHNTKLQELCNHVLLGFSCMVLGNTIDMIQAPQVSDIDGTMHQVLTLT